MTEWLLLGLSAVLVVACGIFVAGEFALLAADRPTIERLAEGGDRRALGVQAAFRTLSTQLSGVQLAITLTNLVIGLLAEPALSRLLRGPIRAVGADASAANGIAVAVALLLSTLVTMLFGELLPKNLAIAVPIAVVRAVQAPLRAFTWVMHWPIRLLNACADAVLALFGMHTQEELASARSPEEFASLVQHSAGEGTLADRTAQLVVQSLTFGTRRAGEVMTARPSMTSISDEATVADFLATVRATGRSRLPVYASGVVGDIAGVLDLDRAVRIPYERREATRVREVMSPPITVPESLPVDGVLAAMRNHRAQLVIVVDEYGDIAGLITGEDLLEELVGDLQDEFDATEPAARRTEDGWEVSGLLRPDELEAATGIELPADGPFDTLGGLIMQRLGRMPSIGDELEIDHVHLTVSRISRRRIDRVRLRNLPDTEERL